MPRPLPRRLTRTGPSCRTPAGRARRRPGRGGSVATALVALAAGTLWLLPAGGPAPAVAAEPEVSVADHGASVGDRAASVADHGASVADRAVSEPSAAHGAAVVGAHGELRLTLTGAGRTMSWTRGVRLSCPDGAGAGAGAGHHPESARACAELDTVDGQLPRLPGGTEPCTREYAPVTATAEGVWRGQEVSWRGRFATLCELRRATGAVFRF